MARTLNRRLEARLDEETDQLIEQAALLLDVSKSAFVVRVARSEAERVLARSNVTLMAPEVFDALIESLDVPDDAPELADRLRRLPACPTGERRVSVREVEPGLGFVRLRLWRR